MLYNRKLLQSSSGQFYSQYNASIEHLQDWLQGPPIVSGTRKLYRSIDFVPCNGPGYFLLQLKVCILETSLLLAEVRVHENGFGHF